MSYNKLDESKSEIRVITLLPPLSSELETVRCEMVTRSLAQLTPEYAEYLSSCSSSSPKDSSLSNRKATLGWRRRLQGSDVDNNNYVYYTRPPETFHRYVWGDFVALSYAWGDKRQTCMIEVNGQSTQVTCNLEQALKAFRRQREFAAGMQLWVDAICINQKYLEERGHLINRMREIYGGAWTVVAWLGRAGDYSGKALELVQCLSVMSRENRGRQLEKELLRDPNHLGQGCWLALQDLMERDYWYRLWVIQEIVMGASSVILRCGTALLDWQSFCDGVTLLQEHLWLVKDYLLEKDRHLKGLWPESWKTQTLHLVYQDLRVLCGAEESTAGERLTFGRLLDITDSGECQEASDKVYSLVGLMEPHIASKLHPDYSLEPAAVYTTTARAFIEGYQNLEPLREGNPWGPSGCPSWATDWQWEGRLRWSRTENRLWLPWEFFAAPGNTSSSVQLPTQSPYHASGDSRYKASFSVDGLSLSCEGFVIDAVSSLSARGKGYWEWVPSSLSQPGPFKSVYGDFTALSEALYRTLTLDRVLGGAKASPRHASIFHLPSTFALAQSQFSRLGWTWLGAQGGYYFRYERWRNANNKFWIGEHRLEEFFTNRIPEAASEYDTTEAYSCFDRACKTRRFMTTRRGYIGWAPDNIIGNNVEQTEQGDLIAILFGCSTPIVIRPKGRCFQVIGEAYVQGLMDGEAMHLFDDQNLRHQTFEFC